MPTQRSCVLVSGLVAAVIVPAAALRTTSLAQTEPTISIYLPFAAGKVTGADLPLPRTPQPTAMTAATGTSTSTPSPTATEPPRTSTPTPTDVRATATPTQIPGRITGRITANGLPITAGTGVQPEGPQIELRRRDRTGWRKVATAAIADDGRFAFENPPPLGAGEAYQVWWNVDPNLFLTDWLVRWMSRPVEPFGPGDVVDVGTFEVSDTLTLAKPESNDWHTLPMTFSWRGRPGVNENHRFTLARRCGSNSNDINRDDVFQSQPLIGKTSFKLDSLPTGFEFGKFYCWYVALEDTAGGTGWSWIYRRIEFRARLLAAPHTEDRGVAAPRGRAVARKVATTSDPTYTYFADTWWSPSGTYMTLRQELGQQVVATNTRLGRRLRRMAADGRDNVVVKTDGYYGLAWESDTNVVP